MSIPKHIHRIEDPKRTAIAPYNFVELPDKVVEAQPLPSGERYYSDKNVELPRYTGRIECALTTSSPLFTRCALTPEQFRADKEAKAKDIPEFFYTEIDPVTQKPIPAISGSSIRGMLRSLVEIASFSKIERVAKNQLFYRSLGDKALRDIYTSNFIENLGKVEYPPHPRANCYRAKIRAGFLRYQNNAYWIEECEYGRVDRRHLPKQLYRPSKSGSLPNWKYQHQPIYIQIDSERDHFFPANSRHPDFYLRYREVRSVTFEELSNTTPATLVITGDIKHKKLEFAFLHELTGRHEVSEEIIRHFQTDEQITKWQTDAYKKDEPSFGSRHKHGYLRDMEPVFFLLDKDGKIRFLGRTQMFRLPYNASPFNFVPERLRDYSITDIAEAIFGYVDGKKPRDTARAGRVFISDAKYKTDKNGIWYKGNQEDTVTPQILASPKPTTFQHYLVQPQETNAQQKNLKHYASKPVEETVIRGHKLYWHKGNVSKEQIEAQETKEEIEKKRSQYTKIKPIKSGVSFEFSLHFENLSDVELGALMWILDIGQDDQYRLKLGMGKPLGMGAVKIAPKLYVSDRTKRYTQLFNGNNDDWEIGDPGEPLFNSSKYRSAFEKYTLSQLQQEGLYQDIQDFKKIPRIQMLLAMLRWEENLSSEQIEQRQYMELDSFKNRKVLPTPLQQSSQQFLEDQVVEARVVDIKEEEIKRAIKNN